MHRSLPLAASFALLCAADASAGVIRHQLPFSGAPSGPFSLAVVEAPGFTPPFPSAELVEVRVRAEASATFNFTLENLSGAPVSITTQAFPWLSIFAATPFDLAEPPGPPIEPPGQQDSQVSNPIPTPDPDDPRTRHFWLFFDPDAPLATPSFESSFNLTPADGAAGSGGDFFSSGVFSVSTVVSHTTNVSLFARDEASTTGGASFFKPPGQFTTLERVEYAIFATLGVSVTGDQFLHNVVDQSWQATSLSGQLTVEYVFVPSPASLALFAAGACLVVRRRRAPIT